MPQFGSDPQSIAMSSNLYSLAQRIEKLESTIHSFQYSLDTITRKLETQTQMLESLGAKRPPEDTD